ncbi:MAG: 1-acyl-sn-glycerol-3-phosphate acyltransferase [Pseudomonadota bacterium]
MPSFLFRCLYWTTSIFFVLTAIPLLFIPGRRWLMIWLQKYARVMVYWMRVITGIRIEVRGRNKVPKGPCIIASKHQSWGDGYAVFSQIPDLAIVTGDHLEKIPLVGLILRKMEAVVVDSCGGAKAREKLVDDELASAKAKNRKILIYPEGHLAPPGYHFRYKKGVFHMYEAYGCEVIPVATNLGLRWPMEEKTLIPGEAVLEFLNPIEPGLDKDTFMARLEEEIEAASLALLPADFDLPEDRELEFDKKTQRGVPIKRTAAKEL